MTKPSTIKAGCPIVHEGQVLFIYLTAQLPCQRQQLVRLMAALTTRDALGSRDYPRINWECPGDIDTTPLSKLAVWARDTKTRNDGGAAASPFDSGNILEQYTSMERPVRTLHLAAELIIQMWRYLESTHLSMNGLHVHQEGDYHRSAAEALDRWAGLVEVSLDTAESCSERLREEADRPDPEKWKDLRELCDVILNDLPTDLATADQALLPPLSEIDHMAHSKCMWVPKIVDVLGPVESRSPNGFIKIRNKQGYSANLFVPANTNFRNNQYLMNRIGGQKKNRSSGHVTSDLTAFTRSRPNSITQRCLAQRGTPSPVSPPFCDHTAGAKRISSTYSTSPDGVATGWRGRWGCSSGACLARTLLVCSPLTSAVSVCLMVLAQRRLSRAGRGRLRCSIPKRARKSRGVLWLGNGGSGSVWLSTIISSPLNKFDETCRAREKGRGFASYSKFTQKPWRPLGGFPKRSNSVGLPDK